MEVASAEGPERLSFQRDEGTPAHRIPMRRSVNPLSDVVALACLIRLIRRIKPKIVHAHTPKGGLLGTLAAWSCRVPYRLYHLHGLAFETKTGIKRRLLHASDRIACALATHVFAVSSSLLREAERSCVLPKGRGVVLGNGSICGVDTYDKFNPEMWPSELRTLMKNRLGIPTGSLVVGFVGRVAKDKGIEDLHDVWHLVRTGYPKAHLLIVGSRDVSDPVPDEVWQELGSDERVHMVGAVDDPEAYFALMDILVIPSHREGFGLVAIEASAMELPIVCYSVTGLADAVIDGYSGIFVEPRDVHALATALRGYLDSKLLRRSHGTQGRKFVKKNFEKRDVWALLLLQYGELLNED